METTIKNMGVTTKYLVIPTKNVGVTTKNLVVPTKNVGVTTKNMGTTTKKVEFPMFFPQNRNPFH